MPGMLMPKFTALVLVLAITPAIPVMAGSAQEGWPPVLPANRGPVSAPAAPPENYHARYDAAFAASLTGEGSAIFRTVLTPPEVAAESALAARVPGLRISRDEASLLPVFIASDTPGVMLARSEDRSARSAESVARGFLAANRELFGASADDLATLRLVYVTSPAGGATIARFEQVIGGLPLFDTEIAVMMPPGLDVAAVGGRLAPGTPSAVAAPARFKLPPQQAISLALEDLTGLQLAPSEFMSARPERDGYSYFQLASDRAAASAPYFSEETRIRPVLFPLAAGNFAPGWHLELWVSGEPAGSGPVFSYVIDAEDGRVLFRNNLTQSDSFTYRVYAEGTGDRRPWDGPTGPVGTPHPTGTPNGYQAPFIAAPLRTVESLLGPTDPWLPSGATVTTGNNTEAYLDLASPDGISGTDPRGVTTSANTFDYQYDSTQNVNVAVNQQAAIIGMFYQVNWLHDFWYKHGFTEAARNAQTNNYGRGGTGNDSVKAEGQDYSGTDNANMSTPADGGRPKMQMYKFLAGGALNPTRDGTFDMLIVGHEMMHYMSNRLVGNGSGLNNNQGGSMGEGWGDFNAVLTTTLDTDNVVDTTFAIGGQTDKWWCNSTFVDNYYYSIRRYPYSSSKLKNPFTFKDIGPGITTYPGVLGNPCTNLTSSPSEVHNSGEIWAEMLWEAYVGLAKAYGPGPAREKIMQYVIDGMKATPSSPTFTQARAAIVAAATAANGYAEPDDALILWQAFGKRGIGPAAVSPVSSSTTHAGVVEDFTVVASGAPGRVPESGAGALRVAKNAGNSALLDLSWGTSCSAGAINYSVYEGTLGNFTSHLPMNCSTAGALATTVTPAAGPGNRYYLIVPRSASYEGSYGTSSAGAEIPPSSARCRISQDLAVCP
jgi:hypothetical protein